MPVTRYDRAKHHVGLGPSEDEQYGYSISGYSSQGQQYGGSQDFGGLTDLVATPNLSRWTQDDFSGGDGQYVWNGKDPAMFSSCHGMLPAQFGKGLRTVAPMVMLVGTNASIGQARAPLGSFGYSGFLYTVFPHGVARVDLHTGAFMFYDAVGAGGENIINGFAFDASRKQVYFSWHTSAGTNGLECKKLPDFTTPGTTATGLLGGPTGGVVNTGIGLIGDKLILVRDRVAYSLTIPDNTDALAFSSTDWHKVVDGRLPGTLKASCVYSNFLYMLCSDPDDGTTVAYYDPGFDTIFTVCKIPYHFTGASLCEYGGRIYVGGSGRDLNGDDAYGELYEVTGTSVRLVRTYAPESRMTSVSHPWNIASMAVCEGLLFFGNKGKCLSAYDIATDSFFDGPALLEASGVQEFLGLHAARGAVYTYLWHPLDSSKTGFYRIGLPTDALIHHTAKFVTSEFAPEPDRDKRWTQLRVLSRFGEVQAGWSIVGGAPGGDTFDSLPSTTEVRGDNILTTFDLSEVPVSPNLRLQFSFPRDDPDGFTEMVAFTLAFVMLDTGKRAWNFTVNATQYVEARDLEAEVQNVHDIQAGLWRYWRERTPLIFTDVDGQLYRVSVTGMTETRPIIGDPVDLDAEGGAESLIGLQLVEV